DSGIDIESYLAARIAQRIGRGEAKYLVKGTGAGTPVQPKGLDASVTGTVDASAVFTWKDINALKHAIDPAYRNNPKFRLAFNDSTL
ncbi:phage major capsid protein, partial [Morganella morganii]